MAMTGFTEQFRLFELASLKNHSSPGGRELRVSSLLACSEGLKNYTKTLMEGGFPQNQLRPPNIGGGSVGVDVFFSSFICAKRKDILPLSTAGTKGPTQRKNATNIILMANDGFHRTVTMEPYKIVNQ